MKVGVGAEGGFDQRDWGSNAEIGSAHEIDAGLAHRVADMDGVVAYCAAVADEYSSARRAFTVAYARAVGASEETAAARREAEAIAATAEEKAALQEAEVRWQLARMTLRAADTQLKAVQSRAALWRTQRETESVTRR